VTITLDSSTENIQFGTNYNLTIVQNAATPLKTEEGVARAREKLQRKNADLCVVNSTEAIGAEEAEFALVGRDGTTHELGRLTKDDLADRLYDELGL